LQFPSTSSPLTDSRWIKTYSGYAGKSAVNIFTFNEIQNSVIVYSWRVIVWLG
jgi:hypothetical protein